MPPTVLAGRDGLLVSRIASPLHNRVVPGPGMWFDRLTTNWKKAAIRSPPSRGQRLRIEGTLPKGACRREPVEGLLDY